MCQTTWDELPTKKTKKKGELQINKRAYLPQAPPVVVDDDDRQDTSPPNYQTGCKWKRQKRSKASSDELA
jgi:hypothetical protein